MQNVRHDCCWANWCKSKSIEMGPALSLFLFLNVLVPVGLGASVSFLWDFVDVHCSRSWLYETESFLDLGSMNQSSKASCALEVAISMTLVLVQETPQYQTLKRIQKKFLVRANVQSSVCLMLFHLKLKHARQAIDPSSLNATCIVRNPWRRLFPELAFALPVRSGERHTAGTAWKKHVWNVWFGDSISCSLIYSVLHKWVEVRRSWQSWTEIHSTRITVLLQTPRKAAQALCLRGPVRFAAHIQNTHAFESGIMGNRC